MLPAGALRLTREQVQAGIREDEKTVRVWNDPQVTAEMERAVDRIYQRAAGE
jgi:hypothetical protein